MKNGSVSQQDEESTQHGCTKVKRNKVIIAVIIVGILILVAGLFYLGFSGKVETCTKPICVRTANEIRRYIDTHANPCDDFYRFSCGTFLRSTNMQDNRVTSRSVEDITHDEILEQIRTMLQSPIQTEDPKSFNVVKKFYRACMNESAIAQQGLKKIKQIFELSGGWPTLEGYNWKETSFDWMEAVHKLRELGVNFDVFFRVSVDRDRGKGSRYVLTIHEIPYDQTGLSAEVKSMIFEYMVDLSIMFGAGREIARKDASEVLRLYEELYQISKDSKRDNRSEEDYVSLSELQFKYPDIQWSTYLNGLLKPIEHLDAIDEVIVSNPLYIQYMEHFLGTTARRSLANLISWHTLGNLINYMPPEIVEKAYELVERINGKMMNFRNPRWKTCVTETKLRLSPVLSAAYIQNYFLEDTRYNILTMIRSIKEQFEQSLYRIEWMDYDTKELMLKNLHISGEKIPSYADLLNLLEGNKIYGQVMINESDYLEAIVELNLVDFYQKQSKLRRNYEDDTFNDIEFVSGQHIEYAPWENLLTFPVGIFNGIYYQKDRPEYMNYGILGSIIAHEISHSFLRAGHGEQPSTVLRSWWSTNSLVNYDEKLQCLANQYGTFRVPGLSKHLNPANTSEEDVADLAGMKISYDTYVNWVQENGGQQLLPGIDYSPKQLFWISAAIRHCSQDSPEGLEHYIDNDYHTPHQFRVNGPLQNLPEFAFDFGCPAGSKMNPENKCTIW